MQIGQILQVITDNDLRGGQIFAADLHRALEALGQNVRTVALAPAQRERALNFEVLGPSRRHPRTFRELRRAIGASDVVVGHGSTTLPMCAMASRGIQVPFVYRQISEQRFWANTPCRRLRTRTALRTADHVVALWSGASEVLQSDFRVPPTNISVIPNGVPAERCPPLDDDARRGARERFGLDLHRPVLLSLGAFAPEKGVDTLVRAMAEPELDGWQLLLVGAGPEQGNLESLAKEAPPRSIVFHEPVASGAEAVAAADVIGLTSRGGDSMPAVLIEAGMMGVPGVATPIEGIVDIVRDGVTGRIVSIDDPAGTATAVRDVGERSGQFGSAAKEHCLDRFEIAGVAHQWLQTLVRIGS